MDLNSIRHQAFDAIDLMLNDLDSGKARTLRREKFIYAYDSPLHMVDEINQKYNLFAEIPDPFLPDKPLRITMEGANVLNLGGIREYLLDHDTSIHFKDGYPLIMTIQDEGVVIKKWMVYSYEEELGVLEMYKKPWSVVNYRASHRPGIALPTHLMPPSQITFTPISTHAHPPTSVVYYHGNVNTFNAPVEQVQQPVANDNPQLTFFLDRVVREPKNEEKKSKFWLWVERHSWLATIIGVILAILIAIFATHWGK